MDHNEVTSPIKGKIEPAPKKPIHLLPNGEIDAQFNKYVVIQYLRQNKLKK